MTKILSVQTSIIWNSYIMHFSETVGILEIELLFYRDKLHWMSLLLTKNVVIYDTFHLKLICFRYFTFFSKNIEQQKKHPCHAGYWVLCHLSDITQDLLTQTEWQLFLMAILLIIREVSLTVFFFTMNNIFAVPKIVNGIQNIMDTNDYSGKDGKWPDPSFAQS